MAVYYVNAITGSTGNNGTSQALAKQTLAQANTLASAGDTIICTGVFKESLPNSKQLFWRGFGYCEFNGNAGAGSTHSSASGTSYDNITFTNWSSYPLGGVSGLSSVTILVRNCIFRDMAGAIWVLNQTVPMIIENCFFINLTANGIQYTGSGGSTPAFVRNSVFYGNTIDVQNSTNTPLLTVFSYCCFGSAIMFKLAAATVFGVFGGDYNVYDFTNGKCQVSTSTDKTTLATYKAVNHTTTGVIDASAIDRVWRADVGDYANRAMFSNPAGYLLTAGPGGCALGVTRAALCVSNNTNSSMWTGGVFVNTQINGGNIELSAGQTTGTAATDVIDLGASVAIQRIVPTFSGLNYPTTYFDTDTGDSPNYLNLEYRVSAGSFLNNAGSPAWVTAPINGEIAATGRYLQIRMTLRG